MKETTTVKSDSTAGASDPRGYARWSVRAVLFLLAVGIMLPVVNHPRLPVAVPALSPLVAVASLLVTRTFQVTLWIGLAVGLVGLFRRRWFCRWVCPTGTCAEIATRTGSRLGRRCPKLPPVGQWIVLLTLGGALLDYPLLLWLDPLAMFSSLFGIQHATLLPEARWFAIPFAGVLLLSLAWPGAWCTRLCPLGATQDILSVLAGVLKKIAPRSRDRATARPQTAAGLPRRAVLGAMAGVGWATAARIVRAQTPPPLRPPGALDETRFVGLCIRCGNCIRACPSTVIRPDSGKSGMAGLLAPVLDFSQDYCLEDCTRCTDVCPSGAIRRLTPEDKPRTRIGVPQVDMNVCLLGDDRDCAACRTWCPYDAVALVFSEVEYTLTPQIDLEKCPGCGACEVACPTAPAKAIIIVPQ